jgi:hypothetical protein
MEMMRQSSVMDLIKYSHDRNANFKKSSDELLRLVDKFADQEELTQLYHYFEKKYLLPKEVVKQQLKSYIVGCYKYKKARFRKDLSLRWMAFSIVKYIGALIYGLIYSRKCTHEDQYKLVVDDVDFSIQLRRFSKLINLFGKKNVLVVTSDDSVEGEHPGYNVKLLPGFKYYDRFEVLRCLRYELFLGILLCVKASLKTGVNLIPVSMHIIKSFMHYRSLFKSCRSDYLIQERHYNTNAIKNHLFKKMGGIASATIQKNILMLDKLSYYIDIDYFFALGNRTAERAFEYGGRIGRVIPVGSMFMEYYWFSNIPEIEKKYDVVMLGINTMNAYERIDSYAEFMDDYYNSIRWLVRFKKEYPLYRIVIKHHSSAGEDEIENEIISGSGIEVLDKKANSYNIAFNSRCAVTFGSTMGYELNAHGIPAFFFDPDCRCTILPDRDDKLLEGLSIVSYEDFRDSLIGVLDSIDINRRCWLGNPDDLCLDSSTVSDKIYKALIG